MVQRDEVTRDWRLELTWSEGMSCAFLKEFSGLQWKKDKCLNFGKGNGAKRLDWSCFGPGASQGV